MKGTTQPFYEMEKTKENKEKQKRKKRIEREEYVEDKNCRASPQGMWQTLGKDAKETPPLNTL